MKKLYLSLIAMVFVMNFSYAQWTTSGNDIYNTNTGNVGVGTLTPVSLFSVGSSSQFQVNSFGLVSITNTIPEHRFITLDGNYARFLRSTASSNNLFQGKNSVLQVGGIGNALSFNGSNQYFTGPDTGLPSGSSISLSISVWAKGTPSGAVRLGSFTYGYGGATGVSFNCSPTTFNLIYNGVVITNPTFSGGINIADNNWHHIVYTMSGNTILCYIDGVSRASAILNTYNIVLGGSNGIVTYTDTRSGIFNIGSMDQLLVYNTVLSPANIAALYASGAGTSAIPVSSSCIRRYEFEDGTGSTISDSNTATTQYNLTAFNSPTWLGAGNGIVPLASGAAESTFFSSSDGISNSEKGIATWGDFNGRNQQQGKWFQWIQGSNYPLVSNNTGHWLFNPANTSASLPTVASTIDIAGNVTIGSTYAGTNAAPANGLLVQGNLGISTAATTVASKLHVLTTAIGLTQANSTGIYLQNNTAATAALTQYSPGLVFEGQGWKTTATAGSQAVDFREFVVPVQNTGNPTGYLSWGSSVNGGAYADGQMVLTSGGSLAIGTTDPKGYKLAVNGSAVATSMTVKLQANWPDMVFKKAYTLMPLTEVKSYIDKNQHLPEIPSATEVEKDGVNLGEMNRLLVKKVEELTLYLIEKDKEVNEQQAHMQLLEKGYQDQKAQLDSLKTTINQLVSKFNSK